MASHDAETESQQKTGSTCYGARIKVQLAYICAKLIKAYTEIVATEVARVKNVTEKI